MALDYSLSQPSGLSARNAVAVTPSNDDDLTYTSRAVFVGTGGNLNVDMASGDTVLLTAVPAGAFLPISVNRIRSTSTTASNIVAFW
jgi:hypothetical protein